MTKRLNSLAALLITLPSISLVRRDEDGQTLAEYALILALIAVVVVVVVVALGNQIGTIFSNITDKI
jgi:pilus assembly protein Flp/PilA